MGSEAFGSFRPWELARLTDHQIRHVYLLPAVKRAMREKERMDRGGAADAGEAIADAVASGQLPHRAAIVSLYMGHGFSQEAANRLVDDQLREWKTAPADAWWRQAPPEGA